MTTVSVHEAKTHFSRLIEQVLAGEEVVVTRNREPVIRLVPAVPPAPPRRSRIGTMTGRLSDPGDEMLKPWTEAELGVSAWENKPL